MVFAIVAVPPVLVTPVVRLALIVELTTLSGPWL
jgi:hypothetical protein